MILSAIRNLLTWPCPWCRRHVVPSTVFQSPATVRIRPSCAYSRQEGAAARRRPGPRHPRGPPAQTEGRGRMPEPTTAPPPSTQVPPAELPASLREAGLANWIREPLDDAVDRTRRVIVPPAAATMGTPLSGCQGALMAEARGPDALVMMGDNPALPPVPERPTLADFYRLRLSKT